MVIVAFSLVRVRIGVRVGWAEQQAFAEIHEAHEYAGDDDDDQRGREDQRRAERIVSRLQPDAEALARTQILGSGGGGEDVCGGYTDAAVDLPCGDAQLHMPQRPCAGRAACQRHSGLELRHRLKPANRLHGDRKQAEHGHDHDFAGNLETEPDQKQWRD